MNRSFQCLRGTLLSSVFFVALQSASAQLMPVATANGTIMDFDGARVLYQPTSDAHALDIFNLAGGSTTNVPFAPNLTLTSAYLTPAGTVFGTSTAGQSGYDIYNYNGSLAHLSTWSNPTLAAAGRYVLTLTPSYGPARFDTVTGTTVVVPPQTWSYDTYSVNAQGIVLGGVDKFIDA